MNLYESIKENLSDLDKNALLSKIFATFPDISEEDEDYLNSLSKEELIQEIKDRGWVEQLNEAEKKSLPEIQKYIFNKYRDEFDSINEVYDLTDYINRLFSEGGMQKVDDEFFLPSATEDYKKDFKKLII